MTGGFNQGNPLGGFGNNPVYGDNKVKKDLHDIIAGTKAFAAYVTTLKFSSTTAPTTKASGQIWLDSPDMYYQIGTTEYQLLTNINIYPIVGGMVSGNVESGCSVTFDSVNNKLDFDIDVKSVNGKTGAIVLTTTDIGEGTNLYYTDARVDSRITGTWLDTDVTLAANSDAKIPSQKAIKTYADQLIASADALLYKGVIDCSANPNYPAADCGHCYVVSVAGKIGGAAGVSVEAGDMCLCKVDSTATGDQAAVGANWSIVQANKDGIVLGPTSATDGNVALYDGVTGKVIKNSTIVGTDVATAITHAGLTTGNPHSVTKAQVGLTNVTDNAHGYALQAHCSSTNPADSTTYYFGGQFTIGLQTAAARWPVFVPKTGTVKRIDVSFYQGAGTNETSSLYFRLNNTTDTELSTVITNDAIALNYNFTALSIAVTAGDVFEFKLVTPAWATNPTAMRITAVIWIEY